MLLDDILYNLKSFTEKPCCKHDKQYTYKEFYEIVCKVYSLIKDAPKERPIVVYGHKEVYMIASFLACSFLGIAYVPIDEMMGKERIKYILETVNPSYAIGDIRIDSNVFYKKITFEDIINVKNFAEIESVTMKPNDIYYILFTSGTTGVPKGVMVTYENLDSCITWMKKITNIENSFTIYNQAVFSFDLSVADIYLSLATASNHYVGNDVNASKLNEKYDDLKLSDSNMLVFTPSYAELLCLDKLFNEKLLPNLKTIIFCGEVLSKKLVDKLYERFPNIKIINMYGPTECTYAVTSYEVPKDTNFNIPIGFAKDDVFIYIVDDNLQIKEDGEIGEILIVGKSVAKGYLTNNDLVSLNDRKFLEFNNQRAFLTGDLGYKKDNLLYYVSRNDTQIKYKGYRIELLDIENNISNIKGVENVKVKAEKDSDGNVKRIVAMIVLKNKETENDVRKNIEEILPQYMIPKMKFVEKIPLNLNGKYSVDSDI